MQGIYGLVVRASRKTQMQAGLAGGSKLAGALNGLPLALFSSYFVLRTA
jgi:hypothetical protein